MAISHSDPLYDAMVHGMGMQNQTYSKQQLSEQDKTLYIALYTASSEFSTSIERRNLLLLLCAP